MRQKPQKTLSFVLFCQSLNAYYSFSTDDLALGELSTQGISTGGLALMVLSTKGLAQTSMRSIPSHKTPRPPYEALRFFFSLSPQLANSKCMMSSQNKNLIFCIIKRIACRNVGISLLRTCENVKFLYALTQ